MDSAPTWFEIIQAFAFAIFMAYSRVKHIENKTAVQEVKTKVSSVKELVYEKTGALNTLSDQKAITLEQIDRRLGALEAANLLVLREKLLELELEIANLKLAAVTKSKDKE